MAPEREEAQEQTAGGRGTQAPAVSHQGVLPREVGIAAARLGPRRAAALARVAGGAAALGNRAVARLLSRDTGYGYEFADDPLNAGGFGPSDATIRVRPGPVRRTLIEPRTGAQATKAAPEPAEAAPPPEPVAPPPPPTAFRQEILAIIDLVDATGVQEKPVQRDDAGKEKPGTGGIWKRYGNRLITFAGSDQLKANRAAMGEGYTSCGTVLSNIWTLAAMEARKKGENVDIKKAREFAMHTHPTSWVEASANMPESRRPRPGDAYYLQFMDSREQSHVCTLKSITKAGPDRETWISVDGGQRSGPGGLDGVRECTRTYIPSRNEVVGGVASQGGQGRWLFGWTDVDKRVT